MLCSLSNLKPKDLETIKSMESELGQTLLAFSCKDIKVSAVDADKLAKIQELENRLGLSLVAVDA